MSLPGKIETSANVLTIVAAALLSAVLVKVYFLPGPAQPPPQPPPQAAPIAQVGVDLRDRLPSIDWRKNGRTLLLAISTTCHFCKDNEPFYRKLQQELGKEMKIVAVLPQPVSEAERYLNGIQLHVDGIRQASLPGIGVTGTPTMFLVNSSGVITKLWIGKIPPGQEDQVLSTLKKG